MIIFPTLFFNKSLSWAGTPEGNVQASFQGLDCRKELWQEQRKHADSKGTKQDLNPEPSSCPVTMLTTEHHMLAC